MAKDVDLSSNEWIDIVFEGKNKDFGAYELRRQSAKRHNKAMVVIVIVLFLIGVIGLLANTVLQKAEARPEDQIEQAMVDYADAEEEEEEEQEEEQQRVEEQQPEALPEEILNTVKATELQITKDEEVVEEIKMMSMAFHTPLTPAITFPALASATKFASGEFWNPELEEIFSSALATSTPLIFPFFVFQLQWLVTPSSLIPKSSPVFPKKEYIYHPEVHSILIFFRAFCATLSMRSKVFTSLSLKYFLS